jgi:hypothetical protein
MVQDYTAEQSSNGSLSTTGEIEFVERLHISNQDI